MHEALLHISPSNSSETTEKSYLHLFGKISKKKSGFSSERPTYHDDGQLLSELYKAATIATLWEEQYENFLEFSSFVKNLNFF